MSDNASSPAASAVMSARPILIGGVAGILAGLFFGDYASLLRPVGQLYVLLLEVAVYPYLLSSLLHGLGSMSPETAWKLFRAGWPFYVFIWVVSFAVLGILSMAIPAPLPPSLAPVPVDFSAQRLLAVLIPSDLFTALSHNYVPAVILFCIFYGISLQYVTEKQSILSALDGFRQASLKFWSFVVRMVPWQYSRCLPTRPGPRGSRNSGLSGCFSSCFSRVCSSSRSG